VPELIHLIKHVYTLHERFMSTRSFPVFKSWYINEQHNPDDSVMRSDDMTENNIIPLTTMKMQNVEQFVMWLGPIVCVFFACV
jgi:hypothetical protein